MARHIIPEAYKNRFPANVEKYIGSLISKCDNLSNNSISLKQVRSVVRNCMQGEFYALIENVKDINQIASTDRMTQIYCAINKYKLWDSYGVGSDEYLSELLLLEPFPDPEIIRNSKKIASNYTIVLKDLLSIKRRAILETREQIYTGTWRALTIWQSNKTTQSPLISYFKNTIDLLLEIPAFKYIYERNRDLGIFEGYSVSISVLKADTTILPHYGPTNKRLRMQIPLIIPEGDVFIYCHDQIREWDLEIPLILNDIYIHGVYNNTISERVVLLVDIPHPDYLKNFTQTGQ